MHAWAGNGSASITFEQLKAALLEAERARCQAETEARLAQAESTGAGNKIRHVPCSSYDVFFPVSCRKALHAQGHAETNLDKPNGEFCPLLVHASLHIAYAAVMSECENLALQCSLCSIL
jgi:hypothetical protein